MADVMDTSEETLHLRLLVVTSNQRMEIKRNVQLDSISVKDLKETVFDASNLSADKFYVVYGGRVLCNSKSIQYYNIKNGVTLFVTPKLRLHPDPFQPNFQELLSDDRVVASLRTIFNNGTLELVVGQNMSGQERDNVLRVVASLQPLKDNQTTLRVFTENPTMVSTGQFLVEQFMKDQTGQHVPTTREEFIDLLQFRIALFDNDGDFSLEMEGESDELDESGEDLEEEVDQVAESQQQMIDESQALQAHQNHQQQQQQQQQTSNHQPSQAAASQTPSGTSSLQMSEGGAGGRQAGISQEQLSAALTTLQGGGGLSANSSTQQTTTGGPPERGQPTTTSGGRGGGGGGGSSQQGVSAGQLSQALANAMAAQQRPRGSHRPASSQPRGGGRRGESGSSTGGSNTSRRQLYKDQLSQLRSMGITDEVTCLHALEATKGNVEAALEILLGGM